MTTSTRPDLTTQPDWPDGTTARFVTRIGMVTRDPRAVVDIHTNADHPAIHYATCRPCGWTDSDTKRNKVVDKAQDHADGCTALPNPTA